MGWIVTQLEICGLNAILALSVYATLRIGQFSLAQVGFMSIGAYVTGMLTLLWGFALFPALLVAAVVCAFTGILLGYPCLRIRGIYLALATVAFAEVVRVFFHNFVYLKPIDGIPLGPNGSLGFRGIPVLTSWPEILVALVAMICLFAWMERSRIGLVSEAIREDETAAASSGINVVAVKVLMFAFGAAVAAIAGGLYGTYTSFVNSEHFGFHLALISVFYVAVGGTRNFAGPILGAVLLTILPEVLRFTGDYRMVIYGLIVLGIMIASPQGLIDRVRDLGRLLGLDDPHSQRRGATTTDRGSRP
jgi:branched-chain amino acid transport system permease protein